MLKSKLSKSLALQVMQDPEKVEKAVKKLQAAEAKHQKTLDNLLEGRKLKKMQDDVMKFCAEQTAVAEESKAWVAEAENRLKFIEASIAEKKGAISQFESKLVRRKEELEVMEAELTKRAEEMAKQEAKTKEVSEAAESYKKYWEEKAAKLKKALVELGA